MIKHIVMWNVSGSTPEIKAETAEMVKARFEALVGVIPGLVKLEVGLDFSRIDYACDMVLYTEFDSEESLTAYATHPEHLRVRDELVGTRIARYQVDYKSAVAA
jgi:hypothetical protein